VTQHPDELGVTRELWFHIGLPRRQRSEPVDLIEEI